MKSAIKKKNEDHAPGWASDPLPKGAKKTQLFVVFVTGFTILA